MSEIDNKKLVLFGAGKIGRSFIGQLFSRGGYEVVFVDINKDVIEAINKNRQYKVIIKSGKEEVIDIKNVRGVHSDDIEKIIHEVATAGIAAISVGMEGLESVFPLLAKGLVARKEMCKDCPLDIIIAENMRNADVYFRSKLIELLPENYPFDELAGLIETSIGKMVPIMQKRDLQKDILQVFAEPYNTLILNKNGFKNPIPSIEGLAPKENMKAWVDRKLFIHNLGHSSASYIGYVYNPGFNYIYEVLGVPEIFSFVRATMKQAADVLMAKYPGEFTVTHLDNHIDDLLSRFQNKALGDTVFRVGCDLMRKLGPQDRLAGAIKAASELNLPYKKILIALVCGCHFRAADEEGNMLTADLEFEKHYRRGIRTVMTEICRFDERIDGDIISQAGAIDNMIMLDRNSIFDWKLSG
jgi:mannitol-1-phosphate 5-dehydrogenase